jgi:universal stress protein A
MSKTFQTILVPVDFSPYSTEALLYAASIAERFSSSILALHVISQEVRTVATHRHLEQRGTPHQAFSLLGPYSEPLGESPEQTDEVVIDLREQAHTALQQFVPPQLAGHPLELRIEVGHPFEQILALAEREPVDLIVLGTHGRTGLAHTVLGSVAERVVRLAPCPVLTVRAPAPSPET